MWIVGAVIGLVAAGMAFGYAAGPGGAIIGGLIGAYLGRRRTTGADPAERRRIDTERRLLQLEMQIAALQRQVDGLRAGQPAVAEATTIPAPAAMVEPSSAAPAAAEPAEQPDTPIPPPDLAAAPRPAAATAKVAERIEVPAWWSRFMSGNPLAKIGVVLLFFGVASALKLAAQYGLLPIPLRLFLAAGGGVALIAFGVLTARHEARRNFGLAVQGGGFALLYLVIYFMFGRFAMIGPGSAFAGFAAIGVVCAVMAARQDGEGLAVLGLSGAFVAPLLAGGHAETPLPLFSYFALLNALLLGIAWSRSWRTLDIAGFVLTLAVGMAWAVDGYRQEHFLVTQVFVVLFLVAYSAMPVATVLLRAAGRSGWQDGLLLFGTPLVGAFLQAQLMEGIRYGLAWSALAGSIYYFGLWFLVQRRAEAELRLLEQSQLGIAMALLTVAVPLAFDAQVTSAFWAAEGAAVLWFGVRRQRLLSQVAGLVMQLAAGLALLLGWSALEHRLPVANDAVLGAAIVVGAGLFSARRLRSLEGESVGASTLAVVWAALWWLGVGLAEIDRFAAVDLRAPIALAFAAVTVLALEGLARRWSWPQLGATPLLLAALWLATADTIDRSGHPLAGFMALALPAGLALHYVLLRGHERAGAAPFATARHLGAWWLLLIALPLELSWQTERLLPADSWLADMTAWGLVLAAGIALPIVGARRGLWPFASPAGRYLAIGSVPPLAALFVLLLFANLQLDGGSSLLPYLPVLSLFDATELTGMAAMLLLARSGDEGLGRLIRRSVIALAFVWLSALAGRAAHHWGGVPFELPALLDSTLFQALLTILWTVTAIGAMILAARRQQRAAWFAGFALLGVVGAKLLLIDAAGAGTLTWTATLIGVALLVLAAAYFAPLPPLPTKSP